MTTTPDKSQQPVLSDDQILSGYRSMLACIEYEGPEKAIEKFREVSGAAVLAAQAQAVPVAWRYQDSRGHYRYRGFVAGFEKDYAILKPKPLYAAPQPTAQAGEVERLREAAADVVSHIEGKLPMRGWLKDNDKSRAALGRLAAALKGDQP